MRIIFKHILRNIRENKFRSILIVFSLAVSTMVMFMNLTIKDDLTNKYKSVLQGAYQDYDIEIFPKSENINGQYFDKKDLDLSGINIDNDQDFAYGSGIYTYEDKNIDVGLFGCDRETFVNNKLATLVEKSSDYDAKDVNQIIISKKNADKYKIKLGDTVKVNVRGGEDEYKVTAFAETGGYFLMEDDSFFIITDIKYVQDLNGKPNIIEDVMIDLKDGEDAKAAAEILTKNNPDFQVYTLVDGDAIEEALSMINQLLIVVMVAVVILNFYVIRNIIKLIMATRMPVVGTFRSIGATKAKMNLILIFENVVYGVLGSIFGIIFGMLIREPISSIFISAGDAFDYVNIDYGFKPSYIIISVGFSVVLQIAIALSSIIKAGKKSIKDTIFNTLSTSAGIKIRKIIIGFILMAASVVLYFINDNYNIAIAGISIICAISGAVMILPIFTLWVAKILTVINRKLFGPAAELGTKTLHKSKTTRSSIVLITVSIAIMMVIYMTVLSISDIFTKAEDTVEGDILIDGLDMEEDEYKFLNDVEGIERIKMRYYFYDVFALNGKDAEFGVFGATGEDSEIEIDSKLVNNLRNNEIVVDKYYAKQNNIKIGDEITIDSEYMKIRNNKYIVKGFMDSSNFTTSRNMMCVNKEEYFASFSSVPSQMYVFVNNNPDKMKEELRKLLAGTNARIRTKDEFIEAQRQSTNSILGMVEAMLGLSVVLSVFGLMNNQIIGFIQKKKEYAVLYSTSMSKKQLKIMVLFEVLGTFFCGCIFGMGLSLWVVQVLEQILYSIGLCIDISIKFKQLFIAVGGIFVILSLTSIRPIRKVSKIKVVEEIKYE